VSDRRLVIVFWLGPLIAASILLLTVANPTSLPRPANYFVVGWILGTLFGQTTLAAAWSALGPFSLAWRLPLSLAWLSALIIGLAINLKVSGEPFAATLVLGGCALGQWLVMQIPLWALAIGHGIKLQHQGEPAPLSLPQDRQFGIRQLLILTTIVGIVLAVCRVVAGTLAGKLSLDQGETPIFLFLATMGLIMTLPLLMATLVQRWAAVATLIVLILLGLATEWELSLYNIVLTPGPAPDVWHFRLINAFTAAWIVGIVGVLRLGGYGLIASQSPVDSKHR